MTNIVIQELDVVVGEYYSLWYMKNLLKNFAEKTSAEKTSAEKTFF